MTSRSFVVRLAPIAILLVGIAALLILRWNPGGEERSPSLEAARNPTQPALVPISTLVARVLAEKTPPAELQTAVARPPQSVTGGPELYANSLDDAIRLAAVHLTGLSVARVDSVQYVETTAGRALGLFQPSLARNLAAYQLTADAPAWAFVATGAFRPAVSDRVPPAPDTADTLPVLWIVVPKGAYDLVLGDPTSRTYDLKTLGTPVNVPLATWRSVVAPESPSGPPAIAVGVPALVNGNVAVPITTTGFGFSAYTGFNVHLRWDPAVFTFSSANSTGTIITTPLCPAAVPDPDGAGVTYACTSTNGTSTTDAGLLATITLAPAGAGCSPLHLYTYAGADNGDASTGTYTIDAATNTPQNLTTTDARVDQAAALC